MKELKDTSGDEISFFSQLGLLVISWNKMFGETHSNDAKRRGDGYSQFARQCLKVLDRGEAHYNKRIGGNSLLFDLQIPCWYLTWGLLAVICRPLMNLYSNKVYKLLGEKDMTAEQCYVRQAIHYKCGRLKEARASIQNALFKNPSDDLCVELHLDLAKILKEEGYEERARQEFVYAVKTVNSFKELPSRRKDAIVSKIHALAVDYEKVMIEIGGFKFAPV